MSLELMRKRGFARLPDMLSHRFRISTGAVVGPTDGHRGLRTVPQCDLIVLGPPSELPDLFECGEFALALAATRAIIEIKHTLADPRDLLDQLDATQTVAAKR